MTDSKVTYEFGIVKFANVFPTFGTFAHLLQIAIPQSLSQSVKKLQTSDAVFSSDVNT